MTPLPPDMRRALNAECRRQSWQIIWSIRLLLIATWLCGVAYGAVAMKWHLGG